MLDRLDYDGPGEGANRLTYSIKAFSWVARIETTFDNVDETFIVCEFNSHQRVLPQEASKHLLQHHDVVNLVNRDAWLA